MRLVAMIVFLILLSISSWAGTFRDDFEDGNWNGWVPFGGAFVKEIEDERLSVIDGVMRIDAIVPIMDTARYEMGIRLLRDWEDYSFSADMRMVKVDLGH